MSQNIDLVSLVRRWLKDEMPGWKVIPGWSDDRRLIVYSEIGAYPVVELFETYMKFLDDDLIVLATDNNFMPLLSNRLHVAEQGFKKALAARDKYWTEVKDAK